MVVLFWLQLCEIMMFLPPSVVKLQLSENRFVRWSVAYSTPSTCFSKIIDTTPSSIYAKINTVFVNEQVCKNINLASQASHWNGMYSNFFFPVCMRVSEMEIRLAKPGLRDYLFPRPRLSLRASARSKSTGFRFPVECCLRGNNKQFEFVKFLKLSVMIGRQLQCTCSYRPSWLDMKNQPYHWLS